MELTRRSWFATIAAVLGFTVAAKVATVDPRLSASKKASDQFISNWANGRFPSRSTGFISRFPLEIGGLVRVGDLGVFRVVSVCEIGDGFFQVCGLSV